MIKQPQQENALVFPGCNLVLTKLLLSGCFDDLLCPAVFGWALFLARLYSLVLVRPWSVRSTVRPAPSQLRHVCRVRGPFLRNVDSYMAQKQFSFVVPLLKRDPHFCSVLGLPYDSKTTARKCPRLSRVQPRT